MDEEGLEIEIDGSKRVLDIMCIAKLIQDCFIEDRFSAFARRKDDGHVSMFIAFHNFVDGHELSALNDVDDLRKVMTFICDSSAEVAMRSLEETSRDSDESIDEYNRNIRETIERMICESKLMKGEER